MKARIKERDPFAFTPGNKARAFAQLKKYPAGRQASAVMPLLTIAQEQNGGWLTVPAMEYVAEFLEMPVIRVHEVATFYSMYNLKPVGKHVIEVCTTTPCWLRGSDDVVAACEEELGIKLGETTEDGLFTLMEVECAGACVNAPVCAIHRQYFEDLEGASIRKIIRELKAGKRPKAGPQVNRQKSAPIGGVTTLEGFRE